MFSLTEEQLYAMDVQGVRALRPSTLPAPHTPYAPSLLLCPGANGLRRR